MKRRNGTILILGTLLSFCVGFSGVACLITGIDLPVSLWTVAFWCFVSAGVCSLLCRGRLGWLALGVVGLAVGFLWYRGVLIPGLQGLLYRLTEAYRDAFGWKVLRFGTASEARMDQCLPAVLSLAGALTAAVVAWSVARGQSAAPGIMVALPLPLLCLIVADSTPGMIWVWLLFYGLAMLLITSTTRFDDEQRGSRLTLFTALPVALAVIVLFAAVPKNAYIGQSRAEQWADALIPESLQQAWDELLGQDRASSINNDKRKISLTNLGTREETDYPVMTVTAPYSGMLYLRSSAYDTYDGTGWTSSGNGTTLPWPDNDQLRQQQEYGEILISTRFAHAMLYLPYYTTSMSLHGVGKGISNDKKLNYYSVSCVGMPDEAFFRELYPDSTENPHTVSAELKDQCVELPERTAAWAVSLAQEITAGIANDYHKALAIGEYVQSSARYTLDPERMGSGEADFARWFLEESDTGYCVHFATAAAVLLKAAGIPARYVSGYAVMAREGVAVTVTDNDAHAWVEYWLPGFGWTVLDSTPAALPEADLKPEEETARGQGWQLDLSVPGWAWIAVAVLLPVGIIGQWRIRLRRKNRRLQKGDCRQQVLSRWARLCELCELTGEPPEQYLFDLAQEAKFSDHAITNEAVAVFDSAIDGAKGKLRRHNILRRLWYSLILARI